MSDLIDRQAAIDSLRMDVDIIPFDKAKAYVRETIETIWNRLEQLPSIHHEVRTQMSSADCISRQAAIHAVSESLRRVFVEYEDIAKKIIEKVPAAQPDNRLSKIADLMDGTIDHFDLDDAMDLLYQIKWVLKDG